MVIRPIEGVPYMDEADLMKFKGQVEQFRTKVGNLLHQPEGTGLCALDRYFICILLLLRFMSIVSSSCVLL